ncbi:2-C-methyl-D-erythritol 4-phosphate cytidylyltransferase [Arthrobacter sp. zg-Y826]|uniref:2-C-methyl-D-erythritol 4-phosphate cytidylyltransferase n=1 Tax=Arthrobacter jinronghuae TaxID=2964609 RepID=UPI002106BA52|nr:2-C-methyl-D-erythritol 4-phosphate cytidylyltransferase [Arthrobacter jinronghuae]MCQ1957668.1 2-C-methyl-D-erythritol 4-phosphate cytidylyltransferase [Arthrobacter jinronghuae]
MSTTPSRPPRIGVVVVAGGSGQRLGYGMPKAQVPLAGEPMLVHALRAVQAADIAAAIAVAVPAGDTLMRSICDRFPATVSAVDGGATRPESVRAALRALPADLDAVLVHDAARALTPPEVFHRVAAALAAGASAVIPAIPVVDTVKDTAPVRESAESAVAARLVTGTPDRSRLRAVQTPQGFDAALLRRAHEAALSFDKDTAAAVTDDAMLVESLGTEVYVVEGSQLSLKITTPLDLMLAEAILAGGHHRQED